MIELSIKCVLLFSILINTGILIKIFKFVKYVHSLDRNVRLIDKIIIWILTILNLVNIIFLFSPSLICNHINTIFILNINYLLSLIFIVKLQAQVSPETPAAQTDVLYVSPAVTISKDI